MGSGGARGPSCTKGRKAANLGELTQNNFNVPPGFCVTSESLFHHIEQNNVQPKIDAIVAGFDYEDFGGMEEKTAAIRDLITSGKIPEDLHKEIKAFTGPRSVMTLSKGHGRLPRTVLFSSEPSLPGSR